MYHLTPVLPFLRQESAIFVAGTMIYVIDVLLVTRFGILAVRRDISQEFADRGYCSS